MADKKGGLVRNLLLPSYVEAGSNAAFHGQDCESKSEATTAVLDNRTATQLESYMPEDGAYDDGSSAPHPSNENLHTETVVSESMVPPAPGAPMSSAAPRTKFFPSTDPQSSPRVALPVRVPPIRSTSLTPHIGSVSSFPPSPRQDDGGDPSSILDHSSMTASSGAFSSVLGGLNFLKDEDGTEPVHDSPVKEEEQEETPLKGNRSTSIDKANSRDSEALSATTDSFAALTFRNIERTRQESNSDMTSDVNSTASEMGTIVGAPGRLEEIAAMAAQAEHISAEHSEGDIPSTASSASTDELSIPVLESQTQDRDGVFREVSKKQENPSASAIMTAAFRRLGNNLGSRSFSNQSPTVTSMSAPSTPRVQPKRNEQTVSSALSPAANDPQEMLPSFILRSPGSAIRARSTERRRARASRPILSPRTSFRNSGPSRARADSSPLLRHANSLASPIRFARGCLSSDTTTNETGLDSPSELRYAKSWTPRTPKARSLHQSQSWDVTGSGSVFSPPSAAPEESYQSFEFGTSKSMEGDGIRSAFRLAPSRGRIRYANGYDLRGPGGPKNGSDIPEKRDFSPVIAESKDALALRTPHRIEIEREDALDILACLVERSLAFDQELESSSRLPATTESEVGDGDGGDKTNNSEKGNIRTQDDDGVSTFVEAGSLSADVMESPSKTRRAPTTAVNIERSDSYSSQLTDAVSTLRIISQQYDTSTSGTSQPGNNHEGRMRAIDELFRSHTYAVEMRRASKSASAWLRSIGRPGSKEEQVRSQDLNSLRKDGVDLTSTQDECAPDPREHNQSAGEEQDKNSERLDLVSLKAMLHSAQLKAEEKENHARRLNEELSKCRAEIGRLRSASRAEAVFQSPNRSILDNDDDSTSSVDGSKSKGSARMLEDAIRHDASPIPQADGEGDLSVEASFCRSDVQTGPHETNPTDGFATLADAKKEAVLLKAALAEANDKIRKLHGDSQSEGAAPVVFIANPELSKELDEYKTAVKMAQETKASAESRRDAPKLSPFKEDVGSPRRTINVRMLDGENFTTEWDDLIQPLPPPPDHGLRSPIVAALLQQWTSDSSMHDSLLGWMDRIMRGTDLETVPPLTISSLDHQVRDGFSMHVLPLLLRRSDICVNVKTRAHRRTTYDMSVFVSRSVNMTPDARGTDGIHPPSTQKANKAHVMAFRATTQGSDGIAAEDSGKGDLDDSLAARKAKVSDYLRTSASSFGGRSSEAGGPPGSVTYSSITEHATNQSPYRSSDRRLPPSGRHVERNVLPPPPPTGATIMSDDISIGSSMTGGSQKSAQGQASIMGALGGAFGLLRRSGNSKPPTPVPPALQAAASLGDDMSGVDAGVPSFVRQSPSLMPSMRANDDDVTQPYHRVVSAPPGRIGVTFVDYRGHAMVSDVASDSPLEGWVFPSDILIAIDEIPVSGMRVRDIVKLLTTRKDRQRALRMISSHSMSSFTLNTTTLSEVGAS